MTHGEHAAAERTWKHTYENTPHSPWTDEANVPQVCSDFLQPRLVYAGQGCDVFKWDFCRD